MSKKDGKRREQRTMADRVEHKAFQGRVRARVARTGERYQLAFRRQREAEATREPDPPRWRPPTNKDVTDAIASAMGDNTAQRIQATAEASLWNELSTRVDPGTLFDLEDALGTFPEPRRGIAHGVQQVVAALETPVVEAINEATAAIRLKEKVMNEPEQEALREEFLEYARAQNALVEERIAQYHKFLRGGMKQPLLYISRPGRNVVHIKNSVVTDSRWSLIEAGDPKKVGRVHEIRLEGDPAQVRSAFYAGFQEFMLAPL